MTKWDKSMNLFVDLNTNCRTDIFYTLLSNCKSFSVPMRQTKVSIVRMACIWNWVNLCGVNSRNWVNLCGVNSRNWVNLCGVNSRNMLTPLSSLPDICHPASERVVICDEVETEGYSPKVTRPGPTCNRNTGALGNICTSLWTFSDRDFPGPSTPCTYSWK